MVASSTNSFKSAKKKSRNFAGKYLSLLLSSLVLLNVSYFFAAGEAAAQSLSTGVKPKLVVLMVADKFPYATLARFQDKFGSGGLKFLAENGANFSSCRFTGANTEAACGDASIATGASPWSHGIIGDVWYDRRKGKSISCVTDENAQLVGANAVGSSSKLLKGTTIGDQMKLASNGRSKVISLAVEDRQALLLGGRLANIALWFEPKTGNFVTSSQLAHDLPNWAKNYNDQRNAEKYSGKPWQRLLPEAQYGSSARDDYSFERPLPADGKAFPHVINNAAPGEGAYSTLAMTPMANQMVFELAGEALEKENLGQHPDCDYLAIGLTAGNKLIGSFGPNSQEAQDLALRADQSISQFLGHLDQKVGLNNCLIIFTANSGATGIPEFLKERGLDAGRVDPKTFKTYLDTTLDARLGADDWIESFEPPYVYLNFAAIDKNKYRQSEVEALAAKIAHSIPGIAEAITSAQLFLNQVPNGPYADQVRKSYFWERSGELYIVPKPGYIFSSETGGTANGSPYTADAQVPLIIFGAGIKGGAVADAASPLDIAPTIAALLGVEAPAFSEGKPLTGALARVQGPNKARGTETAVSPQ